MEIDTGEQLNFPFTAQFDKEKYLALQRDYWRPVIITCTKHTVSMFVLGGAIAVPCKACIEECTEYL